MSCCGQLKNNPIKESSSQKELNLSRFLSLDECAAAGELVHIVDIDHTIYKDLFSETCISGLVLHVLVLVGELTTNWIDRSQAPREQLDVQVLFSELIFVGLHFSKFS